MLGFNKAYRQGRERDQEGKTEIVVKYFMQTAHAGLWHKSGNKYREYDIKAVIMVADFKYNEFICNEIKYNASHKSRSET